ncbi:MAG: hypothetical protein JNM06_02045 [Blastocatellia bacterium]|nr:hypothetical protein [Blastocatellia bacterium]
MDSSITPNTNTSNINNFLFNNNLTEQQSNKLQSFQKSYQTFSNILEAYISLSKELLFNTFTFNYFLALLAFAGNRTTFHANQLSLYKLIVDHKNPESVPVTNEDTIRKRVWRHSKAATEWMQQTGITLITKQLPKTIAGQKPEEATLYNISFLLYTLIDILDKAYKIIHLHNNNLGKAIQESAKLKATELREAATPQPQQQKEKSKKQKSAIELLAKTILEMEQHYLNLKNELISSKSFSNKQVANILQQQFSQFFNLHSNTMLQLNELKDSPRDELPEQHEICPTSLSHIFIFSNLSHPHTKSNLEDRDSKISDGTDLSHPGDNIHGDSCPLSDEYVDSSFSAAHIEMEIPQGLYTGGTDPSHPGNIENIVLEEEKAFELEEKQTFTVTLFENQFEKAGSEAEMTLDEFANHIGIDSPTVIKPKSESEKDLLRAKQTNKGFCPATFLPSSTGRKDENVVELSMLCFDFDDADLKTDLKRVIELGFVGFIYTSYSHTDQNHRFRLGFPLKEPIPTKYFRILWDKVFDILKREVGIEGNKLLLNIDTNCFNPSRLWYLPAKQSVTSSYYSEVFQGEGFTLLDWKLFIEQEINDFELKQADLLSKFQANSGCEVVELSMPEEKNKKNVSLSSFTSKMGFLGTDKPDISGYRWPSMYRALAEKAGDQSLADVSWCFFCARAGIPMQVAALGLLQVSPKASARANSPYGNGKYYHLETAQEAYNFYKSKQKK